VTITTAPTQTIVCMKWGVRYPSVYVNNLWSMIQRNTARPTRLVCYTDDRTGINPDVTVLPMPSLTLPAKFTNLPWRKISLWAKDVPGISGDVLFLDLDIVITGSLDEFFDYEPDRTFCVIENWTQMGSGIGNTSCYRFRVGSHPYIPAGQTHAGTRSSTSTSGRRHGSPNTGADHQECGMCSPPVRGQFIRGAHFFRAPDWRLKQQRLFKLRPSGAYRARSGLHTGGGPNTRTAFKPPKANEFDMV
jgi:hypothetical protein